MTNFTPIASLVGGALIGASAVLLMASRLVGYTGDRSILYAAVVEFLKKFGADRKDP